MLVAVEIISKIKLKKKKFLNVTKIKVTFVKFGPDFMHDFSKI